MKRNFSINTCGSITTIIAKTKKGLEWLHANLYTESWQWNGNVLFIDSRYAEDIENAISESF